jgi:hypothetical protein
MTSGILYNQAALLGFDRIANVAPNVRLEPLGGASGQAFVGCEFPTRESYRHRAQELAMMAGDELVRGA